MITTIPDALAENIEKMPLISLDLPYRFNGSVIENFEVRCGKCGASLSPDTIHGSFKTTANGHAANLEAFGVCYKCRTITPMIGRFFDDGTQLVKVEDVWEKGTWSNRSVTLLEKVTRFSTQNWQRIVPPLIAVVIVMLWVFVTIKR